MSNIKLLELCDIYFLVMMVILCGSSIFLESQKLYKEGDKIASRKATLVGKYMLGISVVLFLLRVILL
ncbi:hypothetical protein SAMN02745196_01534 [Clostridium collagenovorans DSM 3089]|uniref:Uncharacterized protein n=1 Tax=Clostridium collagenovorans DSM 3089 TaxID=1121306 RepID=A0A1M5W3U5_9CLOT|nr:CLC_0170 family protein [Clostridium collagenovorans]SHH82145.1 hypothetical protein SAMN02745196_01534 [Clostridium collagenovorans DSM 3089]